MRLGLTKATLFLCYPLESQQFRSADTVRRINAKIFPDFQAVAEMSDNGILSDMFICKTSAADICAKYDDKAPLWSSMPPCRNSIRTRPQTPKTLPCRRDEDGGARSRRSQPASQNPQKCWPFRAGSALPTSTPVAAGAAFIAGASLALFDRVLRAGPDGAEPPYAGVLRQRLALKAAAGCAASRGCVRTKRRSATRNISRRLAPPALAGRLHRLYRLFATRPLTLDAETLGLAAELLDLRIAAPTLAGLAAACQEILARAGSPLLAVAGVSRAAMTVLTEAAPLEAEILSLWLADLTLARRLFWRAPIPLLPVSILQRELRRNGRRSRPTIRIGRPRSPRPMRWRRRRPRASPPIFQGAPRIESAHQSLINRRLEASVFGCARCAAAFLQPQSRNKAVRPDGFKGHENDTFKTLTSPRRPGICPGYHGSG